MSELPSIKVAGLNNAIRNLKAIGVPVKELTEAAGKAGDVVAQASRPLVPRRTGLLESSIRVAKQQRKAVVRAGGSKVPYANPIHWGWFRRNIQPQRFFVKGLAQNVGKVWETYNGELQRLLQKYGNSK